MTASHQPDRLDTLLVHAGEPNPRIGGAVSMPIFQSANFEYGGEASYDDLTYIRLNNTPNHLALHEKLAALEGGEAALVTASGMAAISTTLLTVLSSGDHLLAQACLYGGTHDLITKDLPSSGISHDFIDANDPGSWARLLKPTTKSIYVETMTNPLLEVADLEAVTAFAKQHGLVSLIDNTLASPVNFRPLGVRFDLSLHSATKYLNGHSDIVAGAVIGAKVWITRITHRLNHLGGSLDPHAAFLLHRGMKTLAVRMRHHNASAQRIAEFLAQHPAVVAVNYPGLKSHPDHMRAAELFSGYGGVLSLELRDGVAAADRLLERVRLPIRAPSLGGVESLITRPATTSHAGMSANDRRRLGISDGLVRLSIGIEAADDLIADLAQALEG
ncbi:MAG: aminotransferase class I/II-fold pyridoxal phosphate-dependent enzyme [Nitrospirota bacterium]